MVCTPVNIRFTSSLTPEDENIVALSILNAVTGVLDLLPIAYTIRVETSDSQVYQHSGPDLARLQAGRPASPNPNPTPKE